MLENNLNTDDIAAIELQVSPGGYNTITHVHYPSSEGKDVLALVAVYGGIGFKEAHNEKYYMSPAARSIKERISILPKEEWVGRDRFQSILTIGTVGGRQFKRESVCRSLTADDLDAMFSDLVGMRAGDAEPR